MPTKCEHAEWVEAMLKRKLTPFQRRCASIIGLISSGAYNAPVDWEKVDWEWGGKGVSLTWRKGNLATFDFMPLTSLVFLAHDARIRVEITPGNMQVLRITFFQRSDTGRIYQRHPNLAEAIADHMSWLPEDHELLWNNHPEREFQAVADSLKSPAQLAGEKAAAANEVAAPGQAHPAGGATEAGHAS